MKIKVTVKSVRGKCIQKHKIGDVITFDGKKIEGDICIHALYSFLPKIFAMMYGAEFPWESDKDVATHACPDANNPVVFEIRRKKC